MFPEGEWERSVKREGKRHVRHSDAGAPVPADVFEYVLIEMERVFLYRRDPLHLLFPACPDEEQ